MKVLLCQNLCLIDCAFKKPTIDCGYTGPLVLVILYSLFGVFKFKSNAVNVSPAYKSPPSEFLPTTRL